MYNILLPAFLMVRWLLKSHNYFTWGKGLILPSCKLLKMKRNRYLQGVIYQSYVRHLFRGGVEFPWDVYLFTLTPERPWTTSLDSGPTFWMSRASWRESHPNQSFWCKERYHYNCIYTKGIDEIGVASVVQLWSVILPSHPLSVVASSLPLCETYLLRLNISAAFTFLNVSTDLMVQHHSDQDQCPHVGSVRTT